MNIVMIWSGPRSKALALALSEWLPLLIHSAKPWHCPENIDDGIHWLNGESLQFETPSVAIICLTPENQNTPWLLFEAGALSKVLGSTHVYPVMIDMDATDLNGPLSQFQATRMAKDEIRSLVDTINQRLKTSLSDDDLGVLFESHWSRLNSKLRLTVAAIGPSQTGHRQFSKWSANALAGSSFLERFFGQSSIQDDDEDGLDLAIAKEDIAQALDEVKDDFSRETLLLEMELNRLPKGPEKDVAAAVLQHIKDFHRRLQLDHLESLLQPEPPPPPVVAPSFPKLKPSGRSPLTVVVDNTAKRP